MFHVYSTLSNDNTYIHRQFSDDKDSPPLPVELGRVTIKGGANVAGKFFITPMGVKTDVSENDMEWLREDEGFKNHVEKGFLRIEQRNYDVERIVADMELADKSAP